MGWSYEHRSRGTSNRDWFQRQLGEDTEILACATVGGTFYAACRKSAQPNEVWALVCLTRWAPHDWYNFGTKWMDETVGPNEDRCPERILELLTPTSSRYAQGWRDRCRANLAARAARPKVEKGDLVRFAEPLRFTNGDLLHELVFLGRSSFAHPRHHGRYRISRWRERAHELVVAP